MQGTMLWFNEEKGYGFIETEDDERIYVARSGFLPDQEPAGRCKGQPVSFERRVEEGDTRAVEVSFLPQADARRARLRHARGGKSL
jgi:cold shock CspA family protein